MRTYFERGGWEKAGRALRGDLRELLLGFYLTNPLQTRRINELLYQKRKILSTIYKSVKTISPFPRIYTLTIVKELFLPYPASPLLGAQQHTWRQP